MEKQELIQLTNELYCLTLLFPKKEPLRYRLRAAADDILADFVFLFRENHLSEKLTIVKNPDRPLLKNLEVLEAYLAVAMKQNWVKPVELLRIGGKYGILKQELEDTENKAVETPKAPELFNFNNGKINEAGARSNFQRQGKILEMLKEKGKAQVWELKKIFPAVSKRTLRRDFEHLFHQGLVERIGEKNQTFYQVGHK